MTTSRYPAITDELLSAYIDGAVTGAERLAIEQAVNDDPDVAWRLTTLQETVSLLRSLPVVQAPRSFALTAQQLRRVAPEITRAGDVVLEKPAAVNPAARPPRVDEPGAWGRFVEGWRRFWQGGNPALRNAMAASMAALLLLLIVPSLLSTPTESPGAQTQQVQASESLAATMNEGEISTKADAQSSNPVVEMFSTDLPAEAPVADSTAAPAAEDAAIAALAMPEPSDAQGGAPRDAAAPPAPAAEEMQRAVPPAANARILEGAPAAAAGAMVQPPATGDALAFAPAAANAAAGPAALSVEAGPAMAAAAPVDESQPIVAEAALPATESVADALPATESAADAPAAPVEQPASTAVAAAPDDAAVLAATEPNVAAATADSSTSMPESGQARLAPEAAPNAAIAWPAAMSGQMLVLFQLAAGAAVLLFGLLWWRSRRTA